MVNEVCRLLAAAACIFVAQADDKTSELTAVLNAYKANVTSFAYADMAYVLTETQDDRQARAQCECVYNKSNIFYTRVFSNEDMLRDATLVPAPDPGSYGTQSRFRSFRMLSNGTDTLWNVIAPDAKTKTVDSTAQIMPATKTLADMVLTPLSIHNGGEDSLGLGIAFDIMAVLSRESDLELLTFSRISDSVLKLQFRSKTLTKTYDVDIGKGAIPLMSKFEAIDGTTITIEYGDIRQVAGAGWLPFHTVYNVSPTLIKELSVTSIECKSVPDNERFKLTFSEPVPVLHVRNKTSSRNVKMIGLADLGRMSSPGTTSIANGHLQHDPDVVFNADDEQVNLAPWVIAALLALVTAGLLAYRWYGR